MFHFTPSLFTIPISPPQLQKENSKGSLGPCMQTVRSLIVSYRPTNPDLEFQLRLFSSIFDSHAIHPLRLSERQRATSFRRLGHSDMKRAAQWEQSYTISSDDSSDSDSEGTRPITKNGGSQSSKDIMSEVAESRKKRYGGVDYEALSKHGYRGGPSVLKVPPPRVMEHKEQDWSWSTGKRDSGDNVGESYEERERTRAAVVQGENLLNIPMNLQENRKEKKSQSFSQKEKRKRDLGQASRGKNYVEEEKRLLRDSGIYSGFDS